MRSSAPIIKEDKNELDSIVTNERSRMETQKRAMRDIELEMALG